MAKLNARTVILYNKRRIQPETLAKLDAFLKSGDDHMLLDVDATELDSFTCLVIYQRDAEKIATAQGRPPKKS